jgi:hypothetical protein
LSGYQLVGADGALGGAAGRAGAATGGGVLRMDPATPEVPRFNSAKASDSAMKTVARIAVARVSRLAVPRPDMNEPMPCELPIPSPPPSLRWINTTPISARVTNRWVIVRTAVKNLAPGAAA